MEYNAKRHLEKIARYWIMDEWEDKQEFLEEQFSIPLDEFSKRYEFYYEEKQEGIDKINAILSLYDSVAGEVVFSVTEAIAY